MSTRKNLSPTLLGSVLLASLFLSPFVFSQKPDIQIGILEDGPWQQDQQVRSAIQSEIVKALSSTHDVYFPEEKRLNGRWKVAGVRGALDRLIADPEVDCIVAVGALGSSEAATRQFLAKPVVAARVVAPDLLHIPSKELNGQMVSGVENLSYVNVAEVPIENAVALFRDLVGFDNLTLLVMQPARQLYPDLENAVKTLLAGQQLKSVQVIYVKDDAGPVMRRISEATEAVVLTSQPQLDPAEYQKILEFLAETKIPSFTLGPKEDLAAGVLFGFDTKSEVELVSQRVASNLRQIVDGKDAGTLPVALGLEMSLLFNHAVAGAIGFDLQKALQKQAAAAEQSAGAAPSMSPVTDENADVQARRAGPQLSDEALRKAQADVIQKVQRELARISSYSAFDSISFRIDGVDKVTLLGYTMDPTGKAEAERRVRGLEQVEEVVNLIEVLPVSGSDDRIRAEAYARIYGHPTLQRYLRGGGLSTMDAEEYLSDLRFGIRSAQITKGPHAIHILVKNGNVALVGVVATTMEKQVAEVQANSLPGVFSVQNNLQVGS